jgi:RimJ/RimL family protein N-acetyltransferase
MNSVKMIMVVCIRPVQREDWQFILAIRNEEEVRLACHDTSIIDFKSHKKYMEKLEKDPHVYQWIITFENQNVGHTKIIGEEFGYMIRNGFRGQGIGASFHKLVFEEARKLGIKRLKDTIKIANEPSLKLALRTGFVQTGIITRNNKPYAYTLEKILE